MATKTQVFYPSIASASGANILSIKNEGNALGKGTSNTTYAEIGIRTGDNVVSYLYWPFSVGSIPADAVISSVACSVKTALNYVGSIGTATVQLYAGTTKKGSAKSILSSDVAVYTLSVGSWTKDELSSCRLYFYFSRNKNTTGSDRHLKFYGADLSVTYTYQGEKFMLKLEGAYADIPRVFKKLNGVWVEQDDLNNVVVSENGLVNGGEIESAGPVNPSFTIGGNIYYFEDGMTWEEWVDSSYNTLGLYVGNHIFHGPMVFYDDGAAAIVDATETYVNPTWLIAENHAYSLYYL